MIERTIISAKWGNAAHSSVILQTQESASVSVSLIDAPAYFDGWRETFDAWIEEGNQPEEFSEVEL